MMKGLFFLPVISLFLLPGGKALAKSKYPIKIVTQLSSTFSFLSSEDEIQICDDFLKEKERLSKEELVEVYLLRASIFFSQKRMKEGASDLEAAFKTQPKNPLIRLGKASILLLDSEKKGIEELEKLIRDYPNFPYAYA